MTKNNVQIIALVLITCTIIKDLFYDGRRWGTSFYRVLDLEHAITSFRPWEWGLFI